jgi:NADPH:quinone reductase-like Zn-dependent oxidoreductase
VVIDKSREDLWEAASNANRGSGYAVVADANGVSTLQGSYQHLCPTGRLIVFGFHSNLPMGQDMLSPMEWLRMGFRMSQMPKFDAMDLTASNKSLLGFNLSFFVEQIDMLGQLYDQIGAWLEQGELECPRVVEMHMTDIAAAHDLIQSGKSIGKIVMTTNVKLD